VDPPVFYHNHPAGKPAGHSSSGLNHPKKLQYQEDEGNNEQDVNPIAGLREA